MIQKTKQTLFLLLALSLFSHCALQQPDAEAAEGQPLLTVAMDLAMPGYFTFNGQSLGLTYDLLDAYAQSQGKKLQIVSENTPKAYRKQLTKGHLDMVATLDADNLDERQTLVPLYETSYVVLTTRRTARTLENPDSWESLRGKNTLFSQGFIHTQSCDRLLDSLPTARFTASRRNTFELLEKLINGEYDFLICEQSEAQLGCAMILNIEQIHRFDEPVPVCMILDNRRPEESRRFVSWLRGFQQTEASRDLQALYFERGIYQRIVSGGIRNRAAGALSVYDELFQRVAGEEGLDWKLLSAIAYSESKYNAYLVSPRGARGIMQIMPATAKAFHVPVEELMNPEVNVRVGAQLVRKIRQSLQFSADTPTADRNAMLLACYNGGIGHVMDARRLAEKYGANPDSWDDVAQYLRLKAQPEYAQDEVVQCGAFNGAAQTINFVNHVTRNFYAYGGKR
ncbi:MAG: transglycosylase SLT domain-containing protein [Rikenellaceae bacterium]|jgi:membrane-bound lytic murein transglycosylase F|nr:transglycosylase SLT domain-containing protein [Rikenellaceae bacterium]